MLVTHGAAWLTIKAEHRAVRDRARTSGSIAAIASIVLFAIGYGTMARTTSEDGGALLTDRLA